MQPLLRSRGISSKRARRGQRGTSNHSVIVCETVLCRHARRPADRRLQDRLRTSVEQAQNKLKSTRMSKGENDLHNATRFKRKGEATNTGMHANDRILLTFASPAASHNCNPILGGQKLQFSTTSRWLSRRPKTDKGGAS
jgi:hypothetical protein